MSETPTSAVIHGHFYQPPREDPWLERVPREPSAAPFHDWNRRIERECYRPVVTARLLDGRGRTRRVLNALSLMSFDFGPTLLAWLEREAPETYEAILEADRSSCWRLGGRGNAMAMPYHHVILPLSAPRDRLTEIRWGLADFRRRFGREPEGMWLPETAVDDATLDALAGEGIAFTVLAPRQVESVPARGLPGLYRTRSGREIAVFVYDGDLSHGVAFGDLLSNGRRWAERMVAANEEEGRLLTSIATDGETYGHHHRFAEMALAAALDHLESRDDVRVESYASFLARHPPEEEIAIVEPSSWSCVHGVERWRSACGCALEPGASTQQEWRAPLREAVTWLADRLHEIYEAEAGRLFLDPWRVRDAYGAVLDASGTERAAFVEEHARKVLSSEESTRARELLEMERNALRTFTSCAWFFDDLARIEPIQVLRYAARAIELAGEAGSGLEEGLRNRLAKARSNDPDVGDGRSLYDAEVRPGVGASAR